MELDFPIFYIGPVKDTICVGRRYGIGRTQVYYSHFFLIKNISDSVIWMGVSFSVFFLHLEVKNKAGHWVKIGKKLSEVEFFDDATYLIPPKQQSPHPQQSPRTGQVG
jgi:hypothetical protein